VARFEDVAARFWDPTSKHGMLPPLTDELVTSAESSLQVSLPRELLILLRIQNGGMVSRSYRRCPSLPNFYAEDYVPFRFMFGIGQSGQSTVVSLLHTPYLVNEWDLPSPIVLLYGEGHYWVALDYRAAEGIGEPSVTWIDNEMSHELPLAPTFRIFVEGLAASPPKTEL
jgi:hypothetical protein